MTEQPLVTAIVTASVAILVAVVTQVSAWRLERRRQTYERHRSSVLEMQDQALVVREVLAEVGDQLARTAPASDPVSGTVSVAENPELVRRRSQAERALRVRISRIEDAGVRSAAGTWSTSARFALLSRDDDVTPAQEEEAWDAMCEAVRQALARSRPVS